MLPAREIEKNEKQMGAEPKTGMSTSARPMAVTTTNGILIPVLQLINAPVAMSGVQLSTKMLNNNYSASDTEGHISVQ